MLGNLDNTRDIFNRWLTWEPDSYAFYSYIKFEERCQNNKNLKSLESEGNITSNILF